MPTPISCSSAARCKPAARAFGLEGRVFPEVRSLGGAVWVFTFTLYPYVYLLARTALSERAAHLMEAARLLGAPLARRIRAVALPLARPAVAAGVALALMETLADFGVASYFGIQTFTAGIYKAWLAMDNRIAAAQLATMLLVVVAVLLWLEHRAQRRMRFAAGRGARAGSPRRSRCACGAPRWLAWAVCAAGAGALCCRCCSCCARWRPTGRCCPGTASCNGRQQRAPGCHQRRAGGGLALAAGLRLRRAPDVLTRGVVQLAGLGYAVPGAVIVVGLLLPVGWLQQAAPQTSAWVLGDGHGAGHCVGLPGALLRGGAAIGAKRLCAHPAQLGRFRPHAGHGGPGLLARVHWPLLRAPPPPPRCWCLWT
jgi:iron(III) transport system permease protein